jgi:hypothetical protein
MTFFAPLSTFDVINRDELNRSMSYPPAGSRLKCSLRVPLGLGALTPFRLV